MSSDRFPVIRLVPADAERYAELRRRMLADSPWAFASSPEDDRALDPAHLSGMLEQSENAILAVEDPTEKASAPGATRATPTETRPTAASPTRATAPPEPREVPLISAVGVYRAPQKKFRHRAKLWGVFVEPAYRGRGLGHALLDAAIELARGWPGVDYVDLGVSENAPGALRLYERLGFRVWGREPRSLEHEGRRYDELFMALRLTS